MEKKERNITMLELLIYMMIGIVYSVYKVKELKRHEIILTTLIWPYDLLINYIRLIDRVKNQRDKL
jgi:hypothetical protein